MESPISVETTPLQLTVATQNVLLDKTREDTGVIRPQDERIYATAASFLNVDHQFDVVGVQEAFKSKEQHNGEVLSRLVGYGPGFWQLHNEKSNEAIDRNPKHGRKNEYVGLFGSRVSYAESIELGDNRRALMTVITDVAFVTLHWRAGVSRAARETRREHAAKLTSTVAEFDDAVLLGDFNEPPVRFVSSGRDALRRRGFRSVFPLTGQSSPKTFPTSAYRSLTARGHRRWSLDDILVRGDRVRVLGAGVLEQLPIEDGLHMIDSRPRYPTDHEGLWARLEIAPKHD